MLPISIIYKQVTYPLGPGYLHCLDLLCHCVCLLSFVTALSLPYRTSFKRLDGSVAKVVGRIGFILVPISIEATVSYVLQACGIAFGVVYPGRR